MRTSSVASNGREEIEAPNLSMGALVDRLLAFVCAADILVLKFSQTRATLICLFTFEL